MVLVRRFSFAYSFRYTAQATPNGIQNNAVSSVSITVPNIAGKIPPSVIAFRGDWLRNSQLSASQPLKTISKIITPKNSNTIPVQVSRMNHSKNPFSFLIVRGIYGIGLQNIHPAY